VRNLRGRVSPKKTDTTSLIIDELGQFPCADHLPLVNPLPETPILAEEAIEGTGLIEDGQILVTVFGAPGIGKAWISRGRSSGTDPISYAVGWKAIIIPSKVPLLRCNPPQNPSSIAPHPTISLPPVGNPTSVGTDPAGDPFGVSWGFQGQIKRGPSRPMRFFDLQHHIIEVVSNTMEAKLQGLGYLP
jgi:hypothetical protein